MNQAQFEMIIWREAPKKRLFMALCAKFKFETDVFFMILRSKNMKNTSVSKKIFCRRRRPKPFHTTSK
jgi:hypothetical protein